MKSWRIFPKVEGLQLLSCMSRVSGVWSKSTFVPRTFYSSSRYYRKTFEITCVAPFFSLALLLHFSDFWKVIELRLESAILVLHLIDQFITADIIYQNCFHTNDRKIIKCHFMTRWIGRRKLLITANHSLWEGFSHVNQGRFFCRLA